jgi:hypothetical protein
MGYGMALDHKPTPAAQSVLPKLGVFAPRIVPGVNGINPYVMLLRVQGGVGLGSVTKIGELFVVAQAAMGALDSDHGAVPTYCKWL